MSKYGGSAVGVAVVAAPAGPEPASAGAVAASRGAVARVACAVPPGVEAVAFNGVQPAGIGDEPSGGTVAAAPVDGAFAAAPPPWSPDVTVAAVVLTAFVAFTGPFVARFMFLPSEPLADAPAAAAFDRARPVAGPSARFNTVPNRAPPLVGGEVTLVAPASFAWTDFAAPSTPAPF